MQFPGSRLAPLSFDEKEIVRFALDSNDSKIYAVASVTLARFAESQELAAVKLQGALALCRNTITRQRSLRLIDVHATPGIVVWQHSLSSRAELVEVKEVDEERTYLLIDKDLHVTLVFVDDVEASKLRTKFIRTIKRGAGYGKPHFQDTVESPIEMDKLLLDDETIRGSESRVDNGAQTLLGDSNLASSSRHTEAHSTERDGGSTDGPSKSCTIPTQYSGPKRAGNDQAIILDRVTNAVYQQESSCSDASSITPDTWTCTLNGITCQLPDLTASLESVGEVAHSETKYRGGCGIIRRARLSNGTEVAIKTLLVGSQGKFSKGMKERKRFQNEATMQSLLSHSNVLPLLGIVEAEECGLGASLILPWMDNADSLRYVQANPHVPRLPLILGTIRGIAFLHSKGIIHGDIKARNILISDDGVPLLSDFGLTSFADAEDREISVSMANAGSWAWMAIELHRSETPGSAVTQHSDMWAFGMTAIEILTGDHPFKRSEARRAILFRNFEKFPARPEPEECTDGLWELIQNCWEEEPTSRPTADVSLRIIDSIASSHPC